MVRSILFLIALVILPLHAFAVIYGDNDQESIESLSPMEETMAQSVAAMIDSDYLENPEKRLLLQDGIWNIFAIPGGNANSARKLCPDVKFLDEVAMGTCSGVLIAENQIATASHCVLGESDQEFLKRFRWVFQYHHAETIDPQNIYRAISIEVKMLEHVRIFESPELKIINEERKKMGFSPLAADQMDFNPYRDITIIKLDRPVVGIPPTSIDFGPKEVGSRITMVGHPMGLSKKITRNGKIVRRIGDHYLTTTLDSVKGSSGGPVFNAETGALIGLMVNQGIQHAFAMDRKDRYYRLTRYSESEQEAKNLSGLMNISLIQEALKP